jgi:hypothetical protein
MTLQTKPCPWEAQVIEAAQTQAPSQARALNGPRETAALDATLASHLAGCSACRELFDVARSVSRLAETTLEEARGRSLPAAGQIWWKAQLMQRWEAEARATAPVDLMQRAEVIGGLLAGVALLVTLWPDVHRLEAAGGAQAFWLALARILEPSRVHSLVIGGVALFSTVAAFTLRRLFAED